MTQPVEHLLRELAPQVLGPLARRSGDFAAAEDAVQEALIVAAEHWTRHGVPEHPRAWLYRTAERKLTDLFRSEQARRRREELVALEPPAPPVDDHDDTLDLLFLCCHPTLTPASAIALTLRAVGGLTTAEIARAFLVPEATMAQRISRSKARIKAATAELRAPGERLEPVLRVLYLMFNEGYAASAGDDLQRVDLAAEAIRLTRTAHALRPDDGEVAGLLALMLLTHARRAARTGPLGELVPLTEQDRSRWDGTMIAEGVALITETMARGVVGEYQLQASIAAVHDTATSTDTTDWTQIRMLYGLLAQLTDSPMVTLNLAIAEAMLHGPEAGLRLLEPLDEQLPGHHRLDAVRGHLHEMRGDTTTAAKHYTAAAKATTNLPEQQYLTAKAAHARRVDNDVLADVSANKQP
ncbi:RNA polymerase sigma factor [Pseudonocardia sp. TRM90224]|uniref:RNA polymerase sigma factor n=1 Tax=Pseudonocardia sp. TRM90224 TaxID=2812678 RepID=UPI001E33B531|nr:DUF6596 domain-containing protein [Pseudonocardia sp. TRM90224]